MRCSSGGRCQRLRRCAAGVAVTTTSDVMLAPPTVSRRSGPARRVASAPTGGGRMADSAPAATEVIETDDPGWLFAGVRAWGDMDAWHERVADIRRTQPVLPVELPGFTPFWVLTKHADVTAVERDAEHWKNTSQSVLGTDAEWEQMIG